jgi:hypothetical protein
MSKKKLTLLILVAYLSTSLVVGSVLGSSNSVSDSGFISGDCATSLNLNDGQIDPFWECISEYQNVTEFGPGGYVKFSNNKSHLFSLVVCAADSEWVSIEFDADSSNCMATQHDGWAFYIDEISQTVEARDVHFVGTRYPEIDDDNDLSIESIFSGDLVFIEVMRPFATRECDSTGCDIVYMNKTVSQIQFASEADHYGAHTIYYLLITDKPIGEGYGALPDLPSIINCDEIKISVLNLTVVGVFGFMILHFIRRVIFSPIKHESRVVLNSSVPGFNGSPSFRERWKQTFSSEE